MLGASLTPRMLLCAFTAIARLVQGVFDHEQRRAELVGDGAGELLDMGLARRARRVCRARAALRLVKATMNSTMTTPTRPDNPPSRRVAGSSVPTILSARTARCTAIPTRSGRGGAERGRPRGSVSARA